MTKGEEAVAEEIANYLTAASDTLASGEGDIVINDGVAFAPEHVAVRAATYDPETRRVRDRYQVTITVRRVSS